MKKILDIWHKLRIKTKITIAYLTLLMLSFVITFSILSAINDTYTKNRMKNAGMQTVSALKGNLSLIFDSVTQSSNVVYFDSHVQECLRNVDAATVDPGVYKTITNSLTNLILSGDYISGVYIRDSFGNFYGSYANAPKETHPEKIPDTQWFKSLSKYNGNGHFIHGSEDIVSYYGDIPYITYIREIYDSNTYKQLAVLMVTVNETSIKSYFNEVEGEYSSNFFIVDKNGSFIVGPENNKGENERIAKKIVKSESKGYINDQIDGKKVFCVSQNMDIEDWKLVGVFETDKLSDIEPYYSTIVVVIFINVLFVFICSVMLTRLIFGPLSKMEKHMLLVESGQFVEMQTNNQQNEISNLIRVYNHMINSIKQLIEKVKKEEKIIARSELDLIQAQINPHFLYNTLDAVSALALMKDFDNCFKMTQALGSFYRNSLNSGRILISVEDEIQCIKSYLTILNIRYDNQIHAEYDIETGIEKCQIIKLLLQPLVENAVHHGIKQKCCKGTIGIKVFSNEDEIVFIVSDDGIGMSEERINEIMEGKTVTGKSGFGIHSLIQRIKLYYDIDNPVMIHSEIENGTEVIVRVKRNITEETV